MEEYLPQYTQLLGLGLLWVTVHCSGMCGPIVGSLVATQETHGGWWDRLRQRTGHVLAYQTGRAATYLILGASAGAAGAAVEASIGQLTRVAGLIVAVALILAGIAKIGPVARLLQRSTPGSADSAIGRFVAGALRRVRKVVPRRGALQMMGFGAVLGLLPCMLMFWVLGLSASTASPLHGGLIMVGLVALTTPVLLLTGTAPLVCTPAVRRFGQRMVPFAILVSGLWLLMVSMAANAWIDHVHVPFEIWGEKFVIMLW